MSRSFGLCFLLFVLFFTAPSLRAATFTVTTIADTNDGACDSHCSLREAITAANDLPDSDTIVFEGVVGTIQLRSALPDVQFVVRIQGPGAALLKVRGQGATVPHRLFTIPTSSTATISGLMLTNGYDSNGGAIFNRGALILNNCILESNFDTESGGAVCSYGRLVIANCVFRSNTGRRKGGAIFNSGLFLLADTVFSGNSAGIGGAIYNTSSAHITNCLMRKNKSLDAGGGIYSNDRGQLLVDRCNFTGNSSVGVVGLDLGVGGGICNEGEAQLTSSVFSSNIGLSGGALANSGAMTISDCTLSTNLATGTFQSIGGMRRGGAIRNSGILTLNRSTLNNNAADFAGGGVRNTGTLSANNCTFSGNNVANSTAYYSGGGAIFNSNEVRLASCTIYNNQSYSAGGGLKNELIAGSTNHTLTAIVTNCLVAGNKTKETVGADIFGPCESQGYNLIQDSNGATFTGDRTGDISGRAPLLGPLTNNGGLTPTHALLSGSPAINAGNPYLSTAPNDQRGAGFKRIQGGRMDIGAFEAILLAVDDVFLTESNIASGTATFTLSLSSSSSQTITVNAATLDNTAKAGSDYVALPSTSITFAPGQTSKTVSVTVNGDLVDEADEIFKLRLTGATNATIADNEAQCTILDNDATPQIRVTNASIFEGNSSSVALNIPVTLSAPSSFAVKVDFATADNSAKARVGTTGGDYIARTGTLTFAPGETTKNITVSVIGETIYELNENFFVNLTNPVNGTIGRAQSTGTITDDEALPVVTISSNRILEGNSGTTRLLFNLSLSLRSEVPCRVQWSTHDETATAGSDYAAVSSGFVNFAPGSRSAQLFVVLNGDTQFEANETFKILLSDPRNCAIATNEVTGLSETTGTIVNDDAATAIAEESSE